MASGIPDWLRIRRWVSRMSVLGMVIAVGLGAVLLQFRVGSGLQLASYDWLFTLRPTIAMPQAFVVYLDEESHSELKQPLNAAWDRALHARLIDRLSKAGARAIVFDIVFLDHGKGETPSDRALVEAAKASGRVVLGAIHVQSMDKPNPVSIRRLMPCATRSRIVGDWLK
jgi:CHASE2 domain-containing sensor protein